MYGSMPSGLSQVDILQRLQRDGPRSPDVDRDQPRNVESGRGQLCFR